MTSTTTTAPVLHPLTRDTPCDRYNLLIWIPNVVAFVVMLVVGGKQLVAAPLTGPEPAKVADFFTFGASLAAAVVSWATLTPDYGVYHDRKASAWKVFFYTYLGFFVSSVSTSRNPGVILPFPRT